MLCLNEKNTQERGELSLSKTFSAQQIQTQYNKKNKEIELEN